MNITRVVASLAAPVVLASLAGCRSDYAVDIRNMTPQPVYAQIYEEHDSGTVLLASTRLGPGDRGALGPVRARNEKAGVIVDTKPNPKGPFQARLVRGTTVLNVRQKGDSTSGPLEIEEVTP